MELNKIYNEDCLETMKRMPDNFVDLTVTSPPYDNLRTYNGFEFDWHKTIEELYRVTKDGGVVVWVVGDATIKGSETGTSFKQALYAMEVGFNLHDTMIYEKSYYAPKTHRRYEQTFEYMFIFSKEIPKTFNGLLKENKTKVGLSSGHHTQPDGTKKPMSSQRKSHSLLGNIFKYNPETKSKHTAPFPEQLAHDHIISWSNEEDVVYDCFMGSGTTAKVAKQLNRNFIGSEISKEYCEIAEKRLAQETLV